MPITRLRLSVLPMLALVGAAAPQAPSSDDPKVMSDLLQCRLITEDAARLACFDRTVGQFAAAADQGEVRVVDKAAVTRTRRALFGFSLPTLDLFSSHKPGSHHDKDDADEIKEVTANITAVGGGDGSYVFTLDDGSRWQQTDDVVMGRTPKPGNTINIKRGPFGSYKASIGNGPAMKVRRIG